MKEFIVPRLLIAGGTVLMAFGVWNIVHMLYGQAWVGNCVGPTEASETPSSVKAKRVRCAELWEARQ